MRSGRQWRLPTRATRVVMTPVLLRRPCPLRRSSQSGPRNRPRRPRSSQSRSNLRGCPGHSPRTWPTRARTCPSWTLSRFRTRIASSRPPRHPRPRCPTSSTSRRTSRRSRRRHRSSFPPALKPVPGRPPRGLSTPPCSRPRHFPSQHARPRHSPSQHARPRHSPTQHARQRHPPTECAPQRHALERHPLTQCAPQRHSLRRPCPRHRSLKPLGSGRSARRRPRHRGQPRPPSRPAESPGGSRRPV